MTKRSSIIMSVIAVVLVSCSAESHRPAHSQQDSFLNNGDTPSNSDIVPLPVPSHADDSTTPPAPVPGGNAQARSVAVGCQALTIATSHLAAGVYGVAYGGDDGQRLEVTGGCGQYSCTMTGLPAGLAYASGVISGTPTELGSHSVAITCDAADHATNAARTLTLAVAEQPSIQLFLGTLSATGVAVGSDALDPAALPAFTDKESTLVVKGVGHASTYNCSISDSRVTLTRIDATSWMVSTATLDTDFAEATVTCVDDFQNQASVTLTSLRVNTNPCDLPLDIKAASIRVGDQQYQDAAAENFLAATPAIPVSVAGDNVVDIRLQTTSGVVAQQTWTVAHGLAYPEGNTLHPLSQGWDEAQQLADHTFQITGHMHYDGDDIPDSGDLTETLEVRVHDAACSKDQVKQYSFHPVWPADLAADQLHITLDISDVGDTDANASYMIISFLKGGKTVAWAEYFIDECYGDANNTKCEVSHPVRVNSGCLSEGACLKLGRNHPETEYDKPLPNDWYWPWWHHEPYNHYPFPQSVVQPGTIPVTDIDQIKISFADRAQRDCYGALGVYYCDTSDEADFDIHDAWFATNHWYAWFHDTHNRIDDNVVDAGGSGMAAGICAPGVGCAGDAGGGDWVAEGEVDVTADLYRQAGGTAIWHRLDDRGLPHPPANQ